jgi:hypothetical protein
MNNICVMYSRVERNKQYECEEEEKDGKKIIRIMTV